MKAVRTEPTVQKFPVTLLAPKQRKRRPIPTL
jgi:hypothetical protein